MSMKLELYIQYEMLTWTESFSRTHNSYVTMYFGMSCDILSLWCCCIYTYHMEENGPKNFFSLFRFHKKLTLGQYISTIDFLIKSLNSEQKKMNQMFFRHVHSVQSFEPDTQLQQYVSNGQKKIESTIINYVTYESNAILLHYNFSGFSINSFIMECIIISAP